MKQANIKQQLEAYAMGQFMDAEGNTDHSYYNFKGFWFCKSSSLEGKARRLFSNLKTFLKHHPEIDQTKHYVFFENNCPDVGPLYDSFSICDVENGDVIWYVTPKSGHSRMAEIWGVANDWKDAIKTSDTFRELFKD